MAKVKRLEPARPRRRSVRLRWKYGKVDLRGWNLAALDRLATLLEPVIIGAASEALTLGFENEETFVAIGPNRQSDNPLSVRVHVSLGDVDDGPVYEFDLADVVRDAIEWQGHTKELRHMRDALMELVGEMDATLKRAAEQD
jgi:hypothetical protein